MPNLQGRLHCQRRVLVRVLHAVWRPNLLLGQAMRRILGSRRTFTYPPRTETPSPQ